MPLDFTTAPTFYCSHKTFNFVSYYDLHQQDDINYFDIRRCSIPQKMNAPKNIIFCKKAIIVWNSLKTYLNWITNVLFL